MLQLHTGCKVATRRSHALGHWSPLLVPCQSLTLLHTPLGSKVSTSEKCCIYLHGHLYHLKQLPDTEPVILARINLQS